MWEENYRAWRFSKDKVYKTKQQDLFAAERVQDLNNDPNHCLNHQFTDILYFTQAIPCRYQKYVK